MDGCHLDTAMPEGSEVQMTLELEWPVEGGRRRRRWPSDSRVRLDQRVSELSSHLCECGCGQRTMVAARTNGAKGVVKGQPRRFVAGHSWKAAVASARPRYDLIAARRSLGVVAWSPCACGCGEFTRTRWAVGHANRAQYADPIGPLPLCACGCGRVVPSVRARFAVASHSRRVGPEWVENADGCWIWQRRVDKSGYGAMRVDGRDWKAHRVLYEREYGEGSTDGLQVHHECGVKLCVNPAHLSALTPAEHGRIHGDLAREVWRLRRASRV